jgi:hypothetical protein
MSIGKLTKAGYLKLIDETLSYNFHSLDNNLPNVNKEASLKRAIEKGYIELSAKEKALSIIDDCLKSYGVGHITSDLQNIRKQVEEIEEKKVFIDVIKNRPKLECARCNKVIDSPNAISDMNNNYFCSVECYDKY